jgi:diadenosine tetraphosphatase ApaH/serine/threonine PP2A family protein phosphatase
MRYAIIADIHANLAALTAVLRDIKEKGDIDEIWCLGDIVGYGQEPAECIKLVRERAALCVSGNHDLGAAGQMELDFFNPTAAEACRWTAGQLNASDILYLSELPKTARKDNFYLAHGSPRDPSQEYIMTANIAERNFDFFDTSYCLVGHSHIPMAYKQEMDKAVAVSIKPEIGLVMIEHRIIINPGAVGQPRDGDPRASYGIYDSDGQIFRLYRVVYDVRGTQDKMVAAGLPIPLVMRLEQGK